jgi:DNA-directed RNA polymerase specialized sigma24 family protein
MTDSNRELVLLIKELHLSHAEVAEHLDVPLSKVIRWTADDDDKNQEMMPESELRLLKYTLMAENKRSLLF